MNIFRLIYSAYKFTDKNNINYARAHAYLSSIRLNVFHTYFLDVNVRPLWPFHICRIF